MFINFIFISFLFMSEVAMSSTGASKNSPDLETVLKFIGDRYISRVENSVIPNLVNESTVGAVNELTSFTNLFAPSPQLLQDAFQTRKEWPVGKIFETLQTAVRNSSLLDSLFNKSLADVSAYRDKDPAKFREAVNLYFGIMLLWYIRTDYALNANSGELSDDGLFKIVEQLGRSETEVNIEGARAPGSIFAASYLFRFHLKGEVGDLYYFWAAISPRLKQKYKDNYSEIGGGLARNLFDFFVFGLEKGSGKMDGLAQNFLTEFEMIFPSFARHFPFHDNLGIKYFGKLGVFRDQYKLYGNTSMVDRINQLRFQTLSSYPQLTHSFIERIFLKIWGELTNWGTSVSRVIFIGLALFLSLLVTSIGSSLEILNERTEMKDKPKLEKVVFVSKELSDKFVSYATLQHSKHFENKIIDHGFSILIFFYFSVLLGTIVTFLIRHG